MWLVNIHVAVYMWLVNAHVAVHLWLVQLCYDDNEAWVALHTVEWRIKTSTPEIFTSLPGRRNPRHAIWLPLRHENQKVTPRYT